MPYEGEDRRRRTQDHDDVICILSVQTGILENLKELKTDFKTHVEQDNKNFSKILWNLGMGVGIVLTVNAFIGFLIMAKK